jgi:hypothetical protein
MSPLLFLVTVGYYLQARKGVSDVGWSVAICLPPQQEFAFVSGLWIKEGHAKFSAAKYVTWTRNFLEGMSGECYFFANNRTVEMIGAAYFDKANVHLNLTYESPFDIPCLAERNLSGPYEEQYNKDPERFHRPHLYAVWNGKACLLRMVSDTLPRHVIFWMDAGSLRTRDSLLPTAADPFPSIARMRELFPRGTDGRFVFNVIRERRVNRAALPFRPLDIPLLRGDLVEGGCFGGDHVAIVRATTLFWQYHDQFMREGYFVGKEQSLWNAVFVFGPPSWAVMLYRSRGVDQWFAFWGFFRNATRWFPRDALWLRPSTDFVLQ